MQLRDRSGKRYRTGDIIGKGGEATVYQVNGKNHLLAKIFDKNLKDREHKLMWMIEYPPDDPSEKMGHKSIAWPVEMLYDQTGLAGYLMPNIKNAVPVLNVFHPRLRQQTFRGFTQQHLHNTAYNIAAAIGAIHQRGYVVGDLNESNILVSPSTLVTLIDTDSFQVHTRTEKGGMRTHLCKVGKPEYLPPEMQQRDLNKTVRIPEHDRFALAVLIFQLLLNGNHPFRARWTSNNEKLSLPERISQGMFPYSERAKKWVEPVVNIENIHPGLADMFKRCFIIGHEIPSARPTPAEWENVLADSMRVLVPCGKGHVFSPHLDDCPECLSGPMPVRKPVAATQRPDPREKQPIQKKTYPPRQVSKPTNTPQKINVKAVAASMLPTISLPATWTNFIRRYRPQYFKLRRWMRRRSVRAYLLQPGVWGIVGFILGGILGASISGIVSGQILGTVGGLISGALAGAWIEKKIGWTPFFTGLGIVTGMLIWYWFGANTTLTSWVIAGAIGGITGLLIGLSGRVAELTVLWAALGAVGGWYLGSFIAGLIPTDWLGGALSTGMLALVAGMAYSIWKRM